MKKYIIALILILSTYISHSQKIGLSISGNINTTGINSATIPGSTYYWNRGALSGNVLGANIRVFVATKFIDFGIGSEYGTYKKWGKVTNMETPAHNAPSLKGEKVYIRSKYILPNVFANAKFRLATPLKVYAGIMGGMSITPKKGGYLNQDAAIVFNEKNYKSIPGYGETSSIMLHAQQTSITAGIQAGAILELSKKVGIQAEVAVRRAWFNTRATNYSYNGGHSGSYASYSYYYGLLNTKYTVWYYPISLGAYILL